MKKQHINMKAARILHSGDSEYTIVDVAIPHVRPGFVLIEMKAAGYCHTDTLTSRGFYGAPFPVTGGHEIAGVISEVGEGVCDLRIGDRVIALNKVLECGECLDCRKYDRAFCPNGHLAGLHSDGCFSQYFEALAHNTVKIPEDLSYEQAAPLTCAGVTIYNAITKADLRPGQVLGISGLGALGHIGVQIAKAKGLFTVGIDARPEPIELCRTFQHAPDLLLNARMVQPETAKEQITAAMQAQNLDTDRFPGVDAIIVTAEAPQAFDYAFAILARKGRFVLLSQPDIMGVRSQDLIFKDITVVGSLQGNPKTLKETMEFIATNNIQIVTQTWKFEDINRMWAAQKNGTATGKSVLLF